MNINEAKIIGRSYLSKKDEDDNLSIEVPFYGFIKTLYIKLLLKCHREDPYQKITPKGLKPIEVNRKLTETKYESKLFWAFYYKSNLPHKYINFEPFYPGSDRSGGTFIICKKTKNVFDPYTLILGANGLVDQTQLEMLEKDYNLYLKKEFQKVKYKGMWDKGVYMSC